MTEAYDRQPEGTGLKPCDPVIILARLSKKVRPGRADQDYQQGIGIDTQDKRSREWCERERLNVVAMLADYKSGRVAPWDRPTAKPWFRPELMAQYKGVIAYKNDRLSRGAWEDEISIANGRARTAKFWQSWTARNGRRATTAISGHGRRRQSKRRKMIAGTRSGACGRSKNLRERGMLIWPAPRGAMSR